MHYDPLRQQRVEELAGSATQRPRCAGEPERRGEPHLVEEVGRIYGYDRVPSTLPGARTPIRDLYERRDADETAREVLAGRELGREFAMAINRSGKRGERFREGKPDRGDDHGFEER